MTSPQDPQEIQNEACPRRRLKLSVKSRDGDDMDADEEEKTGINLLIILFDIRFIGLIQPEVS
jgi:hypothetical protein